VNFFDDKDSMLQYYGFQAAEFRMRHDAIFSEIKHYAWLISILLASPVALLVGKERMILKAVLPYFIPIPLFGVAFSVLAFFLIRREFHYYNETEARLLYLERELGITAHPGFLDSRLTKAIDPAFSVAGYSKREKPLGSIVPWRARMRMLFLMEFVLFGIAGVAETCIAVAFLNT
jgi:hypothetical protein